MKSPQPSTEQFAWNPDHKAQPSKPGYTFSNDPKHPLWKIKVTFLLHPPMTELIKAPTATAAKRYAETKYLDHKAVEVIGRADQARISRTKPSTKSGATSST